MNKVMRFISDWLWQLPQNLIGILWSLVMSKYVLRTNIRCGMRLYVTSKGGSVTLGKYVFVRNSPRIRETVLHESGHVRQSMILGPLYLIVVGISSIVHAMIHSRVCKDSNYYHFWTERWANKLSVRHEANNKV